MSKIATVFIEAKLDLSGIESQLRGLGSTQARRAGEDVASGIASGVKAKESLLTGVFQGIGQQIVLTLTNTLVNGIQSAMRTVQDTVRQSLDVSSTFDALGKSLDFVSGSAAAGAANMAFVRQEAERIGIPLQQAAEGFTRISAAARGTALEGNATRQVFTAVSQAARVFNLSSEETSGALLALEQIISKGKVSAEELRGQLGERLPGAFQIAARAMGMTTGELDELLQKGLVPASDFIPRFAKQLEAETSGGLAGALATAGAKGVDLSNALIDLKKNFGDALQPAFTATLGAIAEGLKGLQIDFSYVNQLATDFSDYLKANPQIVKQIAADVSAFAEGALKAAVDGARAIFEWWQKNPEVLSQIASIIGNLVEGSLNIAKGLITALTTDLGHGKTHLDDMAGMMERFATASENAASHWLHLFNAMDQAGSFLDRLGSWATQGRSDDWNEGGTGGQWEGGNNSVVAANRRNVGLANSTFFPQDIRNACAMGVRQGLKDAGIQLGVTNKAWDTGLKSEGPAMANSFFGSDISDKINPSDLKPGDLVAYSRGGGRIDHVATYIGDGKAVGTSSSRGMIVEHDVNNSGYGRVLYGARPKAYGTSQAAVDEDWMPNTGGSQGTRNERYLARIAYGEQDPRDPLGAVGRADNMGSIGKYQFIPSTRQEAMRVTGLDPWSKDHDTQDRATILYIKAKHPKAYQAIQRGDFAAADRELNKVWYALPGGASKGVWGNAAPGAQLTSEMMQRQNVRMPSFETSNNPPPGQRITTTSSGQVPVQSRYTPPVDPEQAKKDKEKAEKDAKRERERAEKASRDAAEDARRKLIDADRSRQEARDSERRSRNERQRALDAQERTRRQSAIAAATGSGRTQLEQDFKKWETQVGGRNTIQGLTDRLQDLGAAQSLKMKTGEKGGIDYAAAINATKELIKLEQQNLGLTNQGIDAETQRLAKAEERQRIEAVSAQTARERDELGEQQGVVQALKDQLNVDESLTPLQAERLRLAQELADTEESINGQIRENTEQIAVLLQKQAEKKAGRLDDDTDFASAIQHLQNQNQLLGEELGLRNQITTQQQRSLELEEEQAKVMANWDYAQRWDRFNTIISESRENSRTAMQQVIADMAAVAKAEMEQLDAVWEKANELNFAIVDTIGGSLKGLFSDLISGTKSLGETLLDFLGNLASQLMNLALNGIFGSAQGGTGILGGIFGTLFGSKPSSQSLVPFGEVSSLLGLGIPKFGDGGLVTRPTLAIVGEKGPEVITPVSKMGGGNVFNFEIDYHSNSISAADAARLTDQMAGMIDSKLIQHQKPGGLIY